MNFVWSDVSRSSLTTSFPCNPIPFVTFIFILVQLRAWFEARFWLSSRPEVDILSCVFFSLQCFLILVYVSLLLWSHVGIAYILYKRFCKKNVKLMKFCTIFTVDHSFYYKSLRLQFHQLEIWCEGEQVVCILYRDQY